MHTTYNVDGYEVNIVRTFADEGETICEKILDIIHEIYLQDQEEK